VKRFSAGLWGLFDRDAVAEPRSDELRRTEGAQARVPVPLKSETGDARGKPSQQWRKTEFRMKKR